MSPVSFKDVVLLLLQALAVGALLTLVFWPGYQ